MSSPGRLRCGTASGSRSISPLTRVTFCIFRRACLTYPLTAARRNHAWLLEQLLGKVSCKLAIIDKFGDESFIHGRLQEKGRALTIEQRVRGEGDTAVAAASILARARFVQGIEQLSQHVGHTLPKGASDPAILTTGRELVARYGEEILAQVAKTHFKTTLEILAGR